MATTLATLLTRCKRRVDRENDTFVSDAEWYDYINEGLSELWDVLTDAWEDYGTTSTTIACVSGTDSYSIASVTPAIYKIRGVDLTVGSQTGTLTRFSFRERNRYKAGYDPCSAAQLYQYSLVGSALKLIPSPTVSGTLTVWYVPQLTALTSGGSTDAAIPDGYLDFVVASAAAKAKAKEESDPSSFLAEKEDCKRRIVEASNSRVAGEPTTMTDVRNGRADGLPGYGGCWWW